MAAKRLLSCYFVRNVHFLTFHMFKNQQNSVMKLQLKAHIPQNIRLSLLLSSSAH